MQNVKLTVYVALLRICMIQTEEHLFHCNVQRFRVTIPAWNSNETNWEINLPNCSTCFTLVGLWLLLEKESKIQCLCSALMVTERGGGGGVIVPSLLCDFVTSILIAILAQIPRGSESYQNKIYDWGSSLVPFRWANHMASFRFLLDFLYGVFYVFI